MNGWINIKDAQPAPYQDVVFWVPVGASCGGLIAKQAYSEVGEYVEPLGKFFSNLRTDDGLSCIGVEWWIALPEFE